MKTLSLLFIYLSTLITNVVFAQTSSNSHYLSTNIASGIFFQEAGFYYGVTSHDNKILEFSYAHRFHNLTIIENGGVGGAYIFWKQTGDIIRLGYKYFNEGIDKESNKIRYTYFRFSYWNLHTPNYTNRYGSNGLNMIKREVVSVNKNLLNIAIGFGKIKQLSKQSFIDYFIIFGVSAGQKTIHKYSYGFFGSGSDFLYPENTFEKNNTLYPTIELGFNLGGRW